MLSCSKKGDITIKFHYKREYDDYENWSFYIWERDMYGRDLNPKEFSINKKGVIEDSFGRVLTIFLNKNEEVNKLGFLIKKGKQNEWLRKDIEIDRYIPLKKKMDIYVIEGKNEIFFSKKEALDYLEEEKSEKQISKKKEKIKVKIHYKRYDQDYAGWDIWVWKKYLLDIEKEGKAYQFEEDSFGRVACFFIEKDEDLINLGIKIKRFDWQEKDVDMDRYIDVRNVNEKGELEVYLLQYEEKIFYTRLDVDDSPKILKACIEGSNRICAVLNYPIMYNDTVNSFKVMCGNENLTVKYVNRIQNSKNYEIITKEELFIDKRYTLLKDGYKGIQVSIENRYDSKEFKERYIYRGNDLGLTYTKESSKFRVYAPTANSVKLCLYDAGIEGNLITEMQMEAKECGTWGIEVKGDLNGFYYTYKVDNYGKEREAVDIYVKAVGINGKRGAIINLEETNPIGFKDEKSPELPDILSSIIYEAHVRDLTIDKNSGVKNKGLFLGLTEDNTYSKEGEKTGLAHLKEIGITHLHLLPVFDFDSVNEMVDDGSYNWGYDPRHYNTPKGWYSTNASDPKTRIFEFKKMVQVLHENGIRVIMDVVYNHTAKTEDSDFNKIVPGYYYRKGRNGGFSNGSGCGNETASEREMVSKMIIDSLIYWVKEYHIDGFRFDLMALHDVNLMNRVRQEMDKIRPNIVIYGEGWTGFGESALAYEQQARRENSHKLNRIATFNDKMRDIIKGNNTKEGEREAGFANGASGKDELLKAHIVGSVWHNQINYDVVNITLVDTPEKSINYAAAHDNLTLSDKINCTNGFEREEERQKICKLCNAIVLTSQGIPFLSGGQEFMRTKQGMHNSYNAGDEINKFDWYRKTKYIEVFNYTKRLIAFRKRHPGLRMLNAEQINKNLKFMDINVSNVVGYTINNNANGDLFKKMAVIFNSSGNNVKVTLEGKEWAIALDDRKEEIKELETIKSINDGSELWVRPRSAVILGDVEGVKEDLKIKLLEQEKVKKEYNQMLIK